MSKPDIFADAHCHTSLKYYQQDKTTVWKSIGIPNFLSHLLGFVRYSTADFRRMAKGGVQIAFVVLTPPEQKTFFFEKKLLKKHGGSLSSFLSRIPEKKIEFFQTEAYDHFGDLKDEMEYCIGHQSETAKIRFNSNLRRTKCRYKIIKKGSDLEEILSNNAKSRHERTIAVVFTIESLHGVGCGHVDFNDSANPFNVSEEVFLNRIDALKGISSGSEKAWDYSPVWVTPAHAFNNSHFGHAQSLTKILKNIFDYSEPFGHEKIPPKYVAGINTGISETGKKVIKRLLGIDDVSKGRSNPGKRIFIDIKHMSTRSRRDYYDIIDAYNQNNPGDIIPVIMSHAAVNGKPHLNENDFNPVDSFEEVKSAKGYNPWSINLYDDEIIRIHETRGFAGLVFYEPLLGSEKDLKGMLFWRSTKWADLFGNQIFHIVKTVFDGPTRSDKKEIWNRIGLGTDFDGQLNPPDRFATATKLPLFKKNLRKVLSDKRFDPFRDKQEVDDLVEKICYKNLVAFLNANY